jgi:hypothetical protein
MKRKAVLIGNTSGLQGVKTDIAHFNTFLKSDRGGAWYNHEIETLENVQKSALLKKIDTLRKENFDYVVVLFSGHGGQLRNTVLELNAQGETIEETELRQIAKRQMNIYDCCRAYPETALRKAAMEALSTTFLESINNARQRYESRIMQAIPQQALLYSCSIGQVSYDTPEGGVYLCNLLRAACVISSDQQYKLVGLAHEEAIAPTLAHSKKEKYGPQEPEAVLPKCLSAQQLIISIKP